MHWNELSDKITIIELLSENLQWCKAVHKWEMFLPLHVSFFPIFWAENCHLLKNHFLPFFVSAQDKWKPQQTQWCACLIFEALMSEMCFFLFGHHPCHNFLAFHLTNHSCLVLTADPAHQPLPHPSSIAPYLGPVKYPETVELWHWHFEVAFQKKFGCVESSSSVSSSGHGFETR